MDQDPITEPHPSSSAENYAFISLSQDTLPLNVHGSSDANYHNHDHAPSTQQRRRRRRTSPHDQAILEQEYRKCVKPDKARRREICRLVQMGEKEVQVCDCHANFCIFTLPSLCVFGGLAKSMLHAALNVGWPSSAVWLGDARAHTRRSRPPRPLSRARPL